MTIFGLTLEQWSHFKLYLGLAKPLLLLFYLPVVLVLLALLFRAIRSWKLRLVVIPIYLILAWLIPLGDVTRNSIAMAKVCSQAGLHVYRTVVVDGYFGEYASRDYLKEHGYKFLERPESPGVDGNLRLEQGADGISALHSVADVKAEWEVVRVPFDFEVADKGVVVHRVVVRNRIAGEVIAEDLRYTAWRGWIDSGINSVIENSVGGCERKDKLIVSLPEILVPSKPRAEPSQVGRVNEMTRADKPSEPE